MRLRLSLFIAAAVAMVVLGASPAARADGLETVRKNGVLRVAVPQDFPPFGTVGPDSSRAATTSTRPRCSRRRWASGSSSSR